MPRLNTYIKDDLHRELLAIYGSDIRPAAMVEDLATRRIRAARESSGRRISPVPNQRLDPIVERLRRQADDSWQRGYATGLTLLEPRATEAEVADLVARGLGESVRYRLEPVVDWESLDLLAAAGWKLGDWFKALDHKYGATPDDLYETFATGGENGSSVDSAFEDGAVSALRQVWQRVRGEETAA